jgi:hypothetical protein
MSGQSAAANILDALSAEIVRVDTLRQKLDMSKPASLFPEFMMRRALVRALHAEKKHDVIGVMRALNALSKIASEALGNQRRSPSFIFRVFHLKSHSDMSLLLRD